jgi:hypothetical protein
MRLFNRRPAAEEAPVPGLAETAAASGWRPAGRQPFPKDLTDALHDIALGMYGVSDPSVPDLSGSHSRVLALRDAFCFSDAGRAVTVANARALRGRESLQLFGPVLDVALCAVELPTMLQPGVVYSRRYHLRLHVRDSRTGDPSFDERYLVAGMLASVQGTWLTPQVQQVILAHDDWLLWAGGPTLVCLSQGPFTSADEVLRRARDVLSLVAAIPASVVPARADHSVDDLAARIARIDSIEEALAFLQQLSDADRERLAHSDTALADFADVRTPDEAMLRLATLDPARRMQLMSLFMH